LAVVLVVACVWLHWPAPRVALFEGLCAASLFLMGFWGIGRVLARLSKVELDAGLSASVGFAAYLAAGGVMLALHLFHRAFASGALVVGVLAAVLVLVRSERTAPSPRPNGLWLVLLGVALALLVALSDFRLHSADDTIAYVAFPEKILATGTLFEPYSFRRLGSLGGQSVGLAYLWPYLDPDQAFVADRGIGLSLCLLQVWSWSERAGAPRPTLAYRAAVGLGIASLAAMPINTASFFTGIALALASQRLVAAVRSEESREDDVRFAALGAICVGGFISLRHLHWGVGVVWLVWLVPRAGGQHIEGRAWLRGVPIGVLMITLLGYAISAQLSNGTFIYPLLRGNASPLVAFGDLRLASALPGVGRVLLHPRLLALAAIVALGWKVRGVSRSAKLFLALALLNTVALGALMSASEVGDVARYAAVVAAASAVFAWMDGPHEVGADHGVAGAIVPLALLFFAYDGAQAAKCGLGARVAWVDVAMAAAPRRGRTFTWEEAQVREAQAAVPPGATVFAAVDDPVYLDYRRNPILLADMPGYAGNLPVQQGGEGLRRHLLARGVDYLMYVVPEQSKDYFRPAFRRAWLAADSVVWRTMAMLTLDFTESVGELSRSVRPHYAKDGIVVVRLREEGR